MMLIESGPRLWTVKCCQMMLDYWDALDALKGLVYFYAGFSGRRTSLRPANKDSICCRFVQL